MSWHRRRQTRRGRAAFDLSPLEAAVAPGLTGPRAVRFWGRSPGPGRHALAIFAAGNSERLADCSFDVPDDAASDFTWTLDYPGDVAGAAPLQPATAYRFVVHHADWDLELGDGRFETAPEAALDSPERFAFAVMSCHLPFDQYGELSDRACRLLELLPDALEQHGVKRVLMIGDQMYGDYPLRCSLFDPEYFARVAPPGRQTLLECDRDEVRQLYQRRHRIFWKHPAFADLQARFPCHLILDDHEIVDNFGTSVEHAEPHYENLRQGALDAFYDYQASRALGREHGRRPDAFYQSFAYGSVAAFLMDLRSERRAGAERIDVCSERQWQALADFFAQNRDKHVLFLALSVPLLHVPDWLATAGTLVTDSDGDVADRWTNPKMAESRDRLLRAIHEHQSHNPQQRLVLLGGDVHVGAVSRFAWSDDARDTYQLIASALSNRDGFLVRNLVELVPRIGAVVGHDGNADFEGELLPPGPDSQSEGTACNPFGKLNVGLIEVERQSSHESSVRLKLLGVSEDDGPPRTKVMFDSGRL
ncbi:MAG TPA: alkaline phosphatase D family protein [Polyangiaceae bacterium]|nr:alkaline phosphatase D family protein [Polyangiaceae bacterium]